MRILSIADIVDGSYGIRFTFFSPCFHLCFTFLFTSEMFVWFWHVLLFCAMYVVLVYLPYPIPRSNMYRCVCISMFSVLHRITFHLFFTSQVLVSHVFVTYYPASTVFRFIFFLLCVLRFKCSRAFALACNSIGLLTSSDIFRGSIFPVRII